MNRIFAIAVLCIYTFNLFAQVDNSKKELYQRKVMKFTQMKKTGTILIVAGAGTAVFSGILFSTIKWDKETHYSYWGGSSTSYDTEEKGKFMMSVLGIGCGVGALAGGIVLNRIGNRKIKQYSDKLDKLSLNFNYDSKRIGVQMVCKF